MSIRDNNILRPVWPFMPNPTSQQAVGLVSWWPMWEGLVGGSQIQDLAGGEHFSLIATPAWGEGLFLNGASSQYGTVTPINPRYNWTSYTIAAWIRTADGGSSRRRIISRQSSVPNAYWIFGLNGNVLEIGDSRGGVGSLVTYGTAVNNNQWRLLVATVTTTGSGTSIRGYVDGYQVGSTVNTAATGTHPVVGAMTLTKYPLAGVEYITANIGEVRCYDRALSPEEVFSLYNPVTRWELYWQPWRELNTKHFGATTFPVSASGSVTPVGAIIKETQKPLAGAAATSGLLVKDLLRALAGAVTPTGTAASQTQKTLTGSAVSSGSISKEDQTSAGGAVSPTGEPAKQTQKSLAGSVALAGALEVLRAFLRTFSGSVTLAGTVTKQTQKPLAGTVAPTASTLKELARTLAGSLTPSGAAAITRAILRSFAGSIASAGEITKQAQKSLDGSIASSGTITRLIGKALSGLLGLAGSAIAGLAPGSTRKVTLTISDEAVTTCSISDELWG
jgi:hypothetical protein